MSANPGRGKRQGKDLSPIGAFLGRGLSPQARMRLNLADLSKNWEKVVGEVLARKSRPVSLEDGVLVVACETSSVAQEILARRDIIADRARKEWGLAFEGVRPSVRRIPLPRGAAVKKEAPPPFEPPRQEIEKALARIGGRIGKPEIETALARLMVTFRRRFSRGKD